MSVKPIEIRYSPPISFQGTDVAHLLKWQITKFTSDLQESAKTEPSQSVQKTQIFFNHYRVFGFAQEGYITLFIKQKNIQKEAFGYKNFRKDTLGLVLSRDEPNVIYARNFAQLTSSKYLDITRREVQKLILLQKHPHIVELCAVMEYQGRKTWKIVLFEQLHQMDLYSYLKDYNNLSQSMIQTYTLSLPILKGLEYIHKSGLVHFDLKLQNILIDETPLGPSLRIADFGAAFIQGTLPTNFCTYHYAAPEQCAIEGIFSSDKTVGPHSDMWSFGIILQQIYFNSINLPDFSFFIGFAMIVKNYEKTIIYLINTQKNKEDLPEISIYLEKMRQLNCDFDLKHNLSTQELNQMPIKIKEIYNWITSVDRNNRGENYYLLCKELYKYLTSLSLILKNRILTNLEALKNETISKEFTPIKYLFSHLIRFDRHERITATQAIEFLENYVKPQTLL
jgi:serine/threonine protein kinase